MFLHELYILTVYINCILYPVIFQSSLAYLSALNLGEQTFVQIKIFESYIAINL